MNCSCLKNAAGETLVRDPWCAWHGDIDWPALVLTSTSYAIEWPSMFGFSGGPFTNYAGSIFPLEGV